MDTNKIEQYLPKQKIEINLQNITNNILVYKNDTNENPIIIKTNNYKQALILFNELVNNYLLMK